MALLSHSVLCPKVLVAGALAVIPSAEALQDAQSGAGAADPAKAAAMAATGTALRRFDELMRPVEGRLQALVRVGQPAAPSHNASLHACDSPFHITT